MDPVLLGRIQFAFTAGFHFLFAPLTIGLSGMLCWLLWRYRSTGDEFYRSAAHFWVKIFLVTFAIGVATGIALEFEFGTNWGEYSRYVGDIFGAPLAAEGVFSFFLESSFVAILLFGWNRVKPTTLWFASLMVTIGAVMSGFWIIAANSWQQTPAGYEIVDGRAQLTNIFEAIFNPSTMPRYLHTIDAALMTGAFFVLGISAWMLLKKRHERFARTSLELALIVALVSSIAQLALGDYHANQVVHTQPEKLAAIEGLFETQSNAPVLLFGIPDRKKETVHAAIEIPGMLSILAHGDPDAEVTGLKDFPREDWPPLALTFYPFHLMVYIGLFLIGVSVLGAVLALRGKAHTNRFFLYLSVVSLPLPFLANELGWISAEVGRQPWIVYRLLRTDEGVSKYVSGGEVLFTTIMFVLIYALLFVVWIYLLKRLITKGPDPVKSENAEEEPA